MLILEPIIGKIRQSDTLCSVRKKEMGVGAECKPNSVYYRGSRGKWDRNTLGKLFNVSFLPAQILTGSLPPVRYITYLLARTNIAVNLLSFLHKNPLLWLSMLTP